MASLAGRRKTVHTRYGWKPLYELRAFPEPIRRGVYTFPYCVIKWREDGTQTIVFKCESIDFAREVLTNLGGFANGIGNEIGLVGN